MSPLDPGSPVSPLAPGNPGGPRNISASSKSIRPYTHQTTFKYTMLHSSLLISTLFQCVYTFHFEHYLLIVFLTVKLFTKL